MPEDRSPVKHESVGDDLYAIFVLPEGDHWTLQVTLTDLSPAAESHVGRAILGPISVRSEDEGWERGTDFTQMIQEMRQKRPEYTVAGTSTKGKWKHVAQVRRTPQTKGYHWFVIRFPQDQPSGIAETIDEGFAPSFAASREEARKRLP